MLKVKVFDTVSKIRFWKNMDEIGGSGSFDGGTISENLNLTNDDVEAVEIVLSTNNEQGVARVSAWDGFGGSLSISTRGTSYIRPYPANGSSQTGGFYITPVGGTDDVNPVFLVGRNTGQTVFSVAGNGKIIAESGDIEFRNLPTSSPGQAGRLWNDGGTLKISA